MMLVLVIAIGLPTALGYLAVSLLLGDDRETGMLERLCMAWPLGMGLVTIQMFLLGLLRVPLTLGPIAALPALEAAGLFWWARRRRVPLAPGIASGLWRDCTDRGVPWARRAVITLLVLWAAVKLASVFLETSLRPIWAWDTWANWSVGAKLFYHAKSLLLDAPAGDFFGVGAVSRFGSYPLHNPLMQVWISLWIGSFDEVLVKLTSPLTLSCLSVSLYLFMARETGRLAALGLLVIFLGSPLLSYHGTELYSDLPLSAALAFSLAAFVHALRGRERYWPVAGLFAAIAIWTKDESLFFVLPLLLSAAVHIRGEGAGRPGRAVRFASLLVPFAVIVPWYAFKFSHTFGLGADVVSQKFVFHPEIVGNVLANLLSLDSFNVLILFLPLLLLAAGRPDRPFLHAAFPVVCYLLFFTFVYAFTAFYYQHFSTGTVFFRNLLTAYPSLCLLDALLVKRVRERSAVPAAAPSRTSGKGTKKKR